MPEIVVLQWMQSSEGTFVKYRLDGEEKSASLPAGHTYWNARDVKEALEARL